MASETYEGRLACDGRGNLLADESRRVGTKTIGVFDEDGEPILDENGQQVMMDLPMFKYGKNHWKPVAHDPKTGKYVFLGPNDKSHNEQHHQQFVHLDGTVDESMTDDPSLVNADKENNPHHFGVQPDDPHYEKGATLDGKVTNTRLKNDPDPVAVTATGHTAAYKES